MSEEMKNNMYEVSADELENASGGYASTVVYTVVNGDTLSRIAKQFRVTVAELMRWNSISNPRQLQPGQQLVIHPGK